MKKLFDEYKHNISCLEVKKLNLFIRITIFFSSNIKSYRDKVLKHYDLLDYNTKTEPRGSKIS